MKRLCLIISILSLGACASHETREAKTIIEASSPSIPDWVRDSRTQWDESSLIYVKSQYTIRSNQRVNSCFDLAKIETSEIIARQIAQEIRGELYNLSNSSSEDEQEALTKAIRLSFEGQLSGLKLISQYFERYEVKDTERLTCYTLHTIEPKNLKQIRKRSIQIGEEVRKALSEKQREFVDAE